MKARIFPCAAILSHTHRDCDHPKSLINKLHKFRNHSVRQFELKMHRNITGDHKRQGGCNNNNIKWPLLIIVWTPNIYNPTYMQELETHKGQTLPSCDMCTHIKEGRSMKEATTKQGDCNYQITHGHICTHSKNSL